MAINLLYGCCQVETSTADLVRTRDVFAGALGGRPIEQELAAEITSLIPGAYACEHIGVGEAVFQVNQPDPGMIFNGHPSIHQHYLDTIGPCVTNLNYFVDDAGHARDLLLAMGAKIHVDGPSDSATALGDYGPDNTREGGSDRPFLFVGTRHLIGLDLEIMEPNFVHFSRQTVQYPAYVRPRPEPGEGGLRLERLRIVAADIERTYRNLAAMFLPGCISRPYEFRAGPLGRRFRIGLGGMEIEYCEPLTPTGPLAHALEGQGPGVVAIDFSTSDPEGGVSRAAAFATVSGAPDWLGLGVQSAGSHVACRSNTGFDAVILQRAPGVFDRD
jgi:hypothetical protein